MEQVDRSRALAAFAAGRTKVRTIRRNVTP
jgi:hypothetical protein